MIQIEAPDGSLVEFPDGTDDATIISVMQKEYPSRTGVDTAADIGATVTGGILEGIPIVGPLIRGGVERAAAATDAALGISGRTYDENMAALEADRGRLSEERPILDTASKITGAVGGIAPAVMAAPALFGAGGASLPMSMMAGLGSGAAIGAADSAVRSGGDLQATGEGAAFGGVAGGAGPAVGMAIGAGARAILNAVRGRNIDGKLVLRALQADGLDEATARRAMAELGDEAMIADLGPNLQADMGAIASTPGRGQQIVKEALASRAERAGARTRAAADEVIGPSRDLVADREAFIQSRRTAAAPLYDQAYATPYQPSQTVQTILQTPAGRRALQQAQRLAANEGIPINPEALDVRAVDLISRSLDDQASAAARSGQNNTARVINMLRDRLLADVDQSVPAFAEARAAFAGPSRLMDAMETGQGVFANNVPPGQVLADVTRMSPGERDAFVNGVRGALDQVMDSARNDALAARALFQKPGNREKLQMIVGKEDADKFIAALDREAVFAATANEAFGNSRTAARQAAQAARRDAGGPGAIRQTLDMKPGSAMATLLERLGKTSQSAAREARDAADAQVLTGRDLSGLSQLEQIQQQNARIGQGASFLGQLGVRAGGLELAR